MAGVVLAGRPSAVGKGINNVTGNSGEDENEDEGGWMDGWESGEMRGWSTGIVLNGRRRGGIFETDEGGSYYL